MIGVSGASVAHDDGSVHLEVMLSGGMAKRSYGSGVILALVPSYMAENAVKIAPEDALVLDILRQLHLRGPMRLCDVRFRLAAQGRPVECSTSRLTGVLRRCCNVGLVEIVGKQRPCSYAVTAAGQFVACLWWDRLFLCGTADLSAIEDLREARAIKQQ